MKRPFAFSVLLASTAAALAAQPATGDFTERHDTIYNSLTIEKRGPIVEMRARARGSEALESAIDTRDPMKPIVHYIQSVYGALFIQPEPKRMLMIGLGGAGFHHLFTAAFPDTLLHTIELDPKVLELTTQHMGFKPGPKTPVTIMDGRMFIKRNREQWDWLMLDAYRGGFVPPHLKTEEFYRECAARLSDRGLFISNLHATTELYYSDLKTIQAVFPQVVIFETAGRGNVIAIGVKYRDPIITDPAKWPTPESLTKPVFEGRVDLKLVRAEHARLPLARMRAGKVLSDDFAPVEFLDALKANNADEPRPKK
jgi:spermidine synthase